MTTASSVRSAWEKLSAITCSAVIESGLLVMLPSVVNAEPIREPMATTEAARIRPQTARMRHGCTAQARARYWVNDARGADMALDSRAMAGVDYVEPSALVDVLQPLGRPSSATPARKRDVCSTAATSGTPRHSSVEALLLTNPCNCSGGAPLRAKSPAWAAGQRSVHRTTFGHARPRPAA